MRGREAGGKATNNTKVSILFVIDREREKALKKLAKAGQF